MSGIKIDLWYNDSISDIEKLDCFWSDCDCVYRGNLYKGGRMVGDYSAESVQAIETAFCKG